jgi:hypothetical protein
MVVLALGACASSQDLRSDAAPRADADPDDPDDPDAGGGDDTPDAPPIEPPDARADAPPGAYRHTIAVDGADDFVAGEVFSTTSAPAYAARVTWDDDFVYVGYRGPDLDPTALDTDAKWLFVYVDVDPGTATGATTSLTYNTQAAAFPAGFGAELYARWKCNATFSSLEAYAGGAWTTAAAALGTGHAGDFVELAIPRAAFGGATQVGVVAWMINEKPGFEGSFAGLYAESFTDGYATSLPVTRYLAIDFESAENPNDPANMAP